MCTALPSPFVCTAIPSPFVCTALPSPYTRPGDPDSGLLLMQQVPDQAYTFKKFRFIYFMCINVFAEKHVLYTVYMPCTCEGQKRVSYHLELKLGIIVSHVGART